MKEHLVDCNSLAEKLYLLLDKELSLDEEETFFKHLEKCSHCFDHYEIEKAYLEFIKIRCEKRHIHSETITRVKQVISEQIRLEINGKGRI